MHSMQKPKPTGQPAPYTPSTHLGLALLAGSANSLPDTLRILPSSTTLWRPPPVRGLQQEAQHGSRYIAVGAYITVGVEQ